MLTLPKMGSPPPPACYCQMPLKPEALSDPEVQCCNTRKLLMPMFCCPALPPIRSPLSGGIEAISFLRAQGRREIWIAETKLFYQLL